MKTLILLVPYAIFSISTAVSQSSNKLSIVALDPYYLNDIMLVKAIEKQINTFDFSCFEEATLSRQAVLPDDLKEICAENATEMAWSITVKTIDSKRVYWLEPVFTNMILFQEDVQKYNSFAVAGAHRLLFDSHNPTLRNLFNPLNDTQQTFSLVHHNRERFAGHRVSTYFAIDAANHNLLLRLALDCYAIAEQQKVIISKNN